MTISSPATHASRREHQPPTLITNPIVSRPGTEPDQKQSPANPNSAQSPPISSKPVLVSGPILSPIRSVDLRA